MFHIRNTKSWKKVLLLQEKIKEMPLEKRTGLELERNLKKRTNTVIQLKETCKNLQTQLKREQCEYD